MNQQRRQPRPAGEPRAVGGRPEGPDVNRDRLIFCITSLVGHRVTASLRNNVMYEGIFHSCSLESDYSITLKSARRLPSDGNAKGGDTVPTMIIPGKDFLQVSAMNVAPLAEDGPRKGFATDAEISRKEAESSRDLVPWAGGEHGAGGGLEDGPNDSKWDQFSVNEKMYGISSTYNEDLYTTKLDKNAIPLAKREQADRIAREIESGASYAEVEERIDGEDDEEARFSAVGAPGQGAKETKALSRNPLPQVPERPGQQDLDRGNSRKGMISEMKRINALNLEPTSAKHEDTSSRSRLTMKQQQERSANRLAAQTAQGTNNTADLKSEFQQSLDLISRQEASRAKRQQGEGGWEGNQQGQMAKAGGYPKSGDQSRTPNSSFSFNKSAKPFSLNPQAGEFTPSGGQASGPPPAKAGGNAPNFSVYKKDPNMKSKSLTDILEPFLQRAKGSSPDSSAPDWPDARGPSYHDVLGQPNAGARPMMGPQGGGPIGHMPQMGGWQPQQQPMMQPGQPGQQQQVQQQPGPQQVPPQHGQDQGGPPVMGGGGNAGMMPQMMQSGFVVANAPGGGGGGAGGGGGGGGPGGPPNQMYAGQMYGAVPGQGPHQGGGQGMGGHQVIAFNQQSMMGQGGSQMVPMGMVAAQGQNPGQMGMAPMPKFGGGNQQQMVVMPVMLAPQGQYNQQHAFMPGGPMQGQSGMVPQGGPPGGPPQGDGGQGQMMQQQGMYPRQG